MAAFLDKAVNGRRGAIVAWFRIQTFCRSARRSLEQTVPFQTIHDDAVTGSVRNQTSGNVQSRHHTPMGCDLVLLGQAAVTGHICSEYGGQFA